MASVTEDLMLFTARPEELRSKTKEWPEMFTVSSSPFWGETASRIRKTTPPSGIRPSKALCPCPTRASREGGFAPITPVVTGATCCRPLLSLVLLEIDFRLGESKPYF